ncbi:transcription antiterminator BglG [Erysipelatoclostridium sp. An173]|uniref:BglG family transcription antiterminator n=1 Tax=unclassified Thomasclavelia TaxID=3025756 RepID=UPI000B3ADA5C|nr:MULTISPECIES: BglG family transcription antiterminator [unclassified Thomasclavelia]OUP78572.1 transcription antiterminator BglG [Erysipelatoclostridium sp. An173]
MLNKRQNQIIDILNNDNNWITGKELAKLLNVSDRTIRSDIDVINKFYDCLLIKSNKRLGYQIDEALLFKQDIETKELIPQNSHERCVYIIRELLFKSKEINLIALQDQVFVSGYSIDNDIKKIRKMISEYPSLKLIRSKNYISLRGNEADKRKLYKQLLTEETHGNFLNLNSIADLWSNFDLLEIKDILEDVCELYNYQIREIDFPMIMIHAGVAIERIINRNYINSKTAKHHLNNNIEYQISYEFFHRVSKTIDIELVEDEVVLFAQLLIGSYQKDDEDENLDKLLNQIVDAVIKEVKDYFDINFSKDKDFKLGLKMHLQLLLERQQNNVTITNIYLQEIKRKYPLVFEMAIRAGEVIADICKINVKENELSFLALHLGAAYDRVNSIKRYRAVIIIPHNQMLSNMCIDKLKLRFEERMVIVKRYGFYEETMIKQQEPDLIITTVPLKHNLNIPTVQITLFVNYEDESKVFQTLNLLDKQRYHEDFVVLVNELIRPDLFHVKKQMASSKEVIDFLCDELISKNLADERYKEDVFKRESVSATSFVNGFAVPHSIEITSKESCISIMILDKPVKWGDFEVKLVLLLAIRDTDSHLLKIFFDWLSSIVSDSNKFRQLLEVKNYQEFIQHVIE